MPFAPKVHLKPNTCDGSVLYVESKYEFLCENSIFLPGWVSYLLRCFPILSRGIVVGEQQRCLQSEDGGNGFIIFKLRICVNLDGDNLTSNDNYLVSSVVILVGLFQLRKYSTNVFTNNTTNVSNHSLILVEKFMINYKFKR